MNIKVLKCAVAAVFVAAAGYGVYQTQVEDMAMSEIALANVEALGWGEGQCAEWIMKKCYDDFSTEYGPHYYASCVTTTVAGGIGECAALESHKPSESAPSYDCLECIRYY